MRVGAPTPIPTSAPLPLRAPGERAVAVDSVDISAPPPPVRSACERLAAEMLAGEASAVQREALVVALSAYDLDTMTALRDRGLRVVFEKGLDGGNFTGADPAQWRVRIGAQMHPELLHGLLLHELAHAADCLRGETHGSWSQEKLPADALKPFASQRTAAVAPLHDQFMTRAAIDVAPFAVAQFEKADEYIASRPGEGFIAWGGAEMGVHYETREDRCRVRLQGVPLPPGAAVGQVHAFAVDGGEARLAITAAREATVEVPVGYRPALTWSAYAATKNDVPEFFAEAVSHYLFSDAQRARLEQMDPQTAAWVRSLGLEAQWRRDARSVPTPPGARLEPFVDAMDVAQDDKVAGLEAYYSAVLPRRVR